MHKHCKFGFYKLAIAAMMWSVASIAAANESVELTPGVIVDLSDGSIYIMSPDSAVEAVATDSGEILWSSNSAAKPLAKTGNLLVTQAETGSAPGSIDLVVMDTQQQGQVVSETPYALPADVRATIDDGMSHRFSSQAVAVDQQAFVSWDYQDFPRQGMIMSDEEEEEDQSSAFRPGTTDPSQSAPEPNTFRLDLSTGEASSVTVDDLPPAAASAFVPGVPTAVDLDPRQRLSADGRHTLVSERVADDREWNKYKWSIIDNETGDQIASMKSHLSQAPFTIVEPDTIIVETGPFVRRVEGEFIEEPRSVRAYDLGTGQQLWSRPLRDPAYRGPFPP